MGQSKNNPKKLYRTVQQHMAKISKRPLLLWILIAAIVLFIVVALGHMIPTDLITEGATGSSTTTNTVTGVANPLGNVYTMVNTVTEPDGTVVTDTLDTEGNYVTTVYTSNTMNANSQASAPQGTASQQSTFTEVKQPRTVFQS
jgi:hypothetical protein